MRFLSILLLLVINLTIPNIANAQSSSFIIHGEWGNENYHNIAILNGNYYVSSSITSNKIDVIDPSISGQGSLLASFIPDELSNNFIQSISAFNNHLVVTSSNTVYIYNVNNVSELSLKYSFSGDFFFQQSSVNTKVTDRLYVVSQNTIFVIEYVNGKFKIFDVIDTFTDFSYEIQTVFLNVVDGHIVLLADYYDQTKEDRSIEARVYKEGTHEFVGKYLKGFEETIYISAATAIDKNRIVISDNGTIKTLNLQNNSLELEDNFKSVNATGNRHLAFDKNILWGHTYNKLISYKIDTDNNVSVHSEINFKKNASEEFYLHFYDMKFHDDKLVVASSHHGVSEVQITDDNRFSQVKYLFNQTGEKGRGILEGGNYYVTNPENATVNTLKIETKNKISLLSSQELNATAQNIDSVNESYLFSDYSIFNLYSLKNQQFSNLSFANIGGRGIIIGRDHVFAGRYIAGNYSLIRFKVSEQFDLYESPLILPFPTLENSSCPQGGVVFSDLLLVKDDCQGGQYHVFSHIYDNNLSWVKLIPPIEGIFNGRALVVENYLYFIDQDKIRITKINESTEVEVLAELSIDTQYNIASTLLAENLLFVSTQHKVLVFDVKDPLDPIEIDQFNADYGNKIEMTYKDNMLVRTLSYRGIIQFHKLNFSPEISMELLTIDEDTETLLTEYISDPENDSFTISLVVAPTNGELSIDNSIYTPNTDFNGEDSFTIKIEDEHGNFIEQEIIVTVLPVNDVPVINVTQVSAVEDTELVVSLDIVDVEDDQLSFSIKEAAVNGSASINDKGELTYTPNANYHGSDSVQVSVFDIHGASTSETINIVVESVNDVPVLLNEIFEGEEDSVINGQLSASDLDGHAFSFSIVAGSAVNGQVSIQNNGQFVFTPAENYFGEASFVAQVTDVEQGSAQEMITLTIAAKDDAPVAESISTSVTHNGSDSGSLATTDIDGDSLTYTVVNDVSNGTLTLTESGEYSYTANTGYSGSDSFTYEVSDGNNTSQGTITFSVQSAPVVPAVEKKKDTSSSGGGGSFGLFMLSALIILVIGRFNLISQKRQ